MTTETPVREVELTPEVTPVPRRVKNVSMEMRLRLADMLDKRHGIVDDPSVPTEELVRRAQEATKHLMEEDPCGASRGIIAMREE